MRIFGVGLAALALALPCCAHGAPALALNTAVYAPITSPAHDGVLALLYAELFRRAGVPVTLQAASAERALLNANSGVDDGDVARIAVLEGTYRNYLRKKYQALAPLLAEHLRRMKRDGSHRRILERVLGPYARQAMAWAR